MKKLLAHSTARLAFLQGPVAQGILAGFAAPLVFFSMALPLEAEIIPSRSHSLQRNVNVARAWRNVGRRLTNAADKVMVDDEKRKSA